MYVARVRNGFVPALRRQVFRKPKDLEVPDCPFVNLPEKAPLALGRGSDGRGHEEVYLAAA